MYCFAVNRIKKHAYTRLMNILRFFTNKTTTKKFTSKYRSHDFSYLLTL